MIAYITLAKLVGDQNEVVDLISETFVNCISWRHVSDLIQSQCILLLNRRYLQVSVKYIINWLIIDLRPIDWQSNMMQDA